MKKLHEAGHKADSSVPDCLQELAIATVKSQRAYDPSGLNNLAHEAALFETHLQPEWRHAVHKACMSRRRPRRAPQARHHWWSKTHLRLNSYVYKSASKRRPPCRNSPTGHRAILPPSYGRNPRSGRDHIWHRPPAACPCREYDPAYKIAANILPHLPPPWRQDHRNQYDRIHQYQQEPERRQHCEWRLAPAPMYRHWQALYRQV